MSTRGRLLLLVFALIACAHQATPDLGAALTGIDQSRFLACSGPPVLEFPQGSQDRMSFVTNLRRGQSMGVVGPTALPPASCSVDALFENAHLVRASFSGDLTMCQLVFAPCMQK
jgi:hypothetical protein